jgi:regulator of RNase E activity RraB
MNVGIQQMILETTGKNSIKYLVESGKEENAIGVIEKHLNANDIILLLAEG